MNPDLLLALVEHSRLVMVVLDRTGRILTLNPRAAELAGQPLTDLVGRPFRLVLDPFSQAKAGLLLKRVQAEGHVEDWELDHAAPNGLPVLVGYDATLLRNEAGEPIGIALVGRDLSAKLELTARLAETNQKLEGALLQLEKAHTQLKATQVQLVQSEKMRALGQMVAGVAHEINNPAAFVSNNLAHLARLLPALRALFEAYAPLRALAGSKQLAALQAAENLAEMEFFWQDLPDLVHESQDGLERIGNIVLSLRNFARLDEVESQPADINLGLQSTLQLVRHLCQDRIELKETYGNLPPVLCRPGELNQVFLNLLTNAIQAIPGRGQVWVSSACADGKVTVTIRDTGSGMDAKTIAQLGEPFFTTKPVGSGMGLGLAVSLSIVERHRGWLRFESELGRGTTAIVEIPVGDEQI